MDTSKSYDAFLVTHLSLTTRITTKDACVSCLFTRTAHQTRQNLSELSVVRQSPANNHCEEITCAYPPGDK